MPKVTESHSTSQTTTLGEKMCVKCKTASQTDKTIAHNKVFVQGGSSFLVESVKIHESSANHVRATSIVAASYTRFFHYSVFNSALFSVWTTRIRTGQVGHHTYSPG